MSVIDHDENVKQEPEGVNLRLVVGIAVGTLVVFGAAVAIAGWMLPDGLKVLPDPHPVGADPIESVPVSTIRGHARGQERQHEAREHLRSFGWVDESEGVAHIPIDDAMDLWLEGAGGLEEQPTSNEEAAP